jgi:translocation and assembly module TamA
VCLACAARGTEPPDGEPSVPYRARLAGLRYGELKNAVRAQSLTISLVQYPPATVRQLRKRAEDDLPAMTAALKASGHLEGTISLDVDGDRVPARVTFQIHKGPRYALGAFRVDYPPGSAGAPAVPPRLGWRKGAAASVANVAAAEAAALRFLQKRGYPHPRLLARAVARDEIRQTVDVVRTVDPGAPARLGAPEFQGLVRVRPAFVQNRVSWTPGERYDVEELEDFEKGLLRSGLFAAARVVPAEEPDAAGNLPVRVDLAERPRRTVRAGATYYTDEGFGGQASWENRNLFGNAEALALTLQASEIKYEAKSVFTRPDLFAPDLDLHLEVGASDEHPDAYRSRETRYSLWLEKRLAETLTLKGGAAYELDQVDERDEESRFGLVSLPMSAEWDLRDDALDPYRGANFFLATTPYRDAAENLAFLKSYGEASVFLPLARSPRVALATRAGLGILTGAAVDDVPADKRFFAGGGGTIRGYAYQSVGELEDGKPTGGNSIATVSAELRARVARSVGLAAFIDGGTAYAGSHPDADTPFLWGAGLGVRYYMGSTPFRFDVAFPLQPRADVDDPFQIYISLGQSF